MSVLSRVPKLGRRGPRRDRPPAARTLLLGMLSVVAFTLAGYFLLRVYNGVPGVKYNRVLVSLPTVGNLLPHDAVRVSGTRVGQVLKLDIGDDGRPMVELQLNPGTQVPDDTKAFIRANGLLGARYVELRPGKSTTPLPDGSTIKAGASSYTYGLPETVAVFDAGARGGLKKTVDGLAQGLLGNGTGLNTGLEVAAPAPREFDELAAEILQRDGAAGRLVPALESTTAALDRTRSQSGAFMQSAGDALQPIVDERDAVQAAIAAAPATLSAAEDGLRRGRRILSSVRGLSSEAELTLPPAPAGLSRLVQLLQEGQAPLRRAEPTVRRLLPPTADEATVALQALDPVVPRLQSGIATARPILKYIGDYGCDVANTGAALRSMTGFGQAGRGINGPAMAFRLQAIIPAGLAAVGVKDETGLLQREAYEPPCKYISRAYPQNNPLAPDPNASPPG